MDEVARQRAYYMRTANSYDAMHSGEVSALALTFLNAAIKALGVRSVLDVGSGTGRVIQALPDVDVIGIEPVEALREVGYANGIPRSRLLDGDATRLAMAPDSVDLACAFAALHHIPRPDRAIREMLRVSCKAIFIADANNFGQGRLRVFKQAVNALGLWPVVNFLKTGGKGYIETPGDGISYSFSIFTHLPMIERECDVHVLNLSGRAGNPYRHAPSVAMLAIKKRHPLVQTFRA